MGGGARLGCSVPGGVCRRFEKVANFEGHAKL